MKKSRLDIAYEKIHQKFDKITPTGRLSKVKSNNLSGFLCVAIHCGLERIKHDFGYEKSLKELEKCGITKDFIIEENEKMKFKKQKEKPVFIELKIDFNNQVPEGYTEPKSEYDLKDIFKKSDS